MTSEISNILLSMKAAFEVVEDLDSTQKEAFDAIDRIRKYRAMIGELTA